MSDLSVTAASVLKGSNATIEHGISGETIAQGKQLYKSSSTGKWMLADSNSATVEARTPTATALCGASLDQPITVQKRGDITIGATLVANTAYYMSDTPGGICPLADVGTGEYMTLIGIAKSTTVLTLAYESTGVAN
jgi:hypothetical protein